MSVNVDSNVNRLIIWEVTFCGAGTTGNDLAFITPIVYLNFMFEHLFEEYLYETTSNVLA